MSGLKRVVIKRYFPVVVFVGCFCSFSMGQTKVHPAIDGFGGIYSIEQADITPNANLDYRIVIDVNSPSADPSSLNPALNNVARLMNLHIEGGANLARMHVVLAVHAGAAYALLNDAAYNQRYGIDNPNTELVNALCKSRVDVSICGQSMVARGIERGQLMDSVKVATSMLTTVTTYQSLGYSFLQF